MQKVSKQNKIIIGCTAIFSIAVIIFAIISNNGKDNVTENKGPGLYDAFAQCLADKGAVMYGAEWCVHCKEQKVMFGDSFKYIKYVECPDNTQLCIDNGVQRYPTWLIGTSTKLEGFDKNKTIKELSDATGCSLP
ncbi:MAG: hypothetical protein ABIF22_00280 [bacterium]